MRIKIRKIGEGLHPNETIVEVQTSTGAEHLVVDRRAIAQDTLAVGAPLQKDGGNVLVELPRETMSGAWRVWVASGELSDELRAA